MKIAYNILSRPGRSSVIISATVAALLLIFTVFSMLSADKYISMLVPGNYVFALVVIAVTLLPGIYLRMYSYSRYIDLVPVGSDFSSRLKITSIFAAAVETVNVVFLLNAFMAAILAGGMGTLGILAIAGFNLFWLIAWGVVAAFFRLKTDVRASNLEKQEYF